MDIFSCRHRERERKRERERDRQIDRQRQPTCVRGRGRRRGTIRSWEGRIWRCRVTIERTNCRKVYTRKLVVGKRKLSRPPSTTYTHSPTDTPPRSHEL